MPTVVPPSGPLSQLSASWRSAARRRARLVPHSCPPGGRRWLWGVPPCERLPRPGDHGADPRGAQVSDVDTLLGEIAAIGATDEGYRRLAWTEEDARLGEWFAAACSERGLTVSADRCGNQWAWWGDPDAELRPAPPVDADGQPDADGQRDADGQPDADGRRDADGQGDDEKA